jgi:membrane protein required for colicin V production
VNQVDALLLVLLVPFALRGYWRGFCRESFGLAGFVGGVMVAITEGPWLSDRLIARGLVQGETALLVAWATLFVATFIVAALAGRLTERLARALFLGGVNRVAGLVFGCAKGAAILAFALLVVEHAAPAARASIDASRVGRPLTQLATRVLQDVHQAERPPAKEPV